MTPKKDEKDEAKGSAGWESRMPMWERVRALVAQARAQKLWLGVMDVRYESAGIPTEVTEEYVLFGDGFCELDSTGQLGGDDAKGEHCTYPKLIPWSAVLHVELLKPVKK